MLKKFIKPLAMLLVVGAASVTSVFAADINVINKEVSTNVSTDTIFVGKTEAETTVTDMFPTLSVAGSAINKEDYTNILDIRYLSGTIDKKIFTLTDKIPQGAETFVLFKSETEGGKVSTDTPITFSVNNLELQKVAKIDPTGKNKYIETGKFVYSSEVDKPVQEPVKTIEEPTKTVDTKILEEEKTGIFESNTLMLLLAFSLAIVTAEGFRAFLRKQKSE